MKENDFTCNGFSCPELFFYCTGQTTQLHFLKHVRSRKQADILSDQHVVWSETSEYVSPFYHYRSITRFCRQEFTECGKRPDIYKMLELLSPILIRHYQSVAELICVSFRVISVHIDINVFCRMFLKTPRPVDTMWYIISCLFGGKNWLNMF